MPPSCCVLCFFPHEGTNFGNFFLKPARMKADTLTKALLHCSLRLSQNPDVIPRNHRLFSALLKLQQKKKKVASENTHGVGFGFPSSVSKTD